MRRKKWILGTLFVSVIVLSLFMFQTATSQTEPFEITDRTVYRLTENELYLTFTDTIGKDQYITDITFHFANSDKTKTIEIIDFLMYQSYLADVYGYVNVPQGKYKTAVNESIPYPCTDNVTKENTTCYRYEMRYYDDKGVLMDCDYVLADKTCLKTERGVVGQETRYDYLPTPHTKDKTIMDGKKIEQKVEGSIPLPKDGSATIKIPMSHLLFYGITVEDWENKYNVSACSQYGCVILDPTWWNASYAYKRSINATADAIINNFPFVANGTAGFTLGETPNEICWLNGNLTSSNDDVSWVYYNDQSDYVFTDGAESNEISYECVGGKYNRTSSPSNVWSVAGANGVYHFDEGSGSTAIDSAENNNGTIRGAAYTSGHIGKALSFDGTSADVRIADINSLEGANSFTITFWAKWSGLDGRTFHDVVSKEGDGSGWSIRQENREVSEAWRGLSFGFVSENFFTNKNMSTEWAFYSFSYDTSTKDVEIRGIFPNGTVFISSSATFSGDSTPNSELVTIGNISRTDLDRGFYGEMDEVKFYTGVKDSDWVLRGAKQGLSNIGDEVVYSPPDLTPPTITFKSQTPADVSSTNILSTDLNITYNITDPSGVDSSTAKVYYKTNSSTSAIVWFINGTATSGWQTETGTNVSDIWNFTLDHSIYPGSYNMNDSVMESEPKHGHTLTNKNSILKIRFFNVSSDEMFNYMILDAENISGNNGFLRIYYCNESYATGEPNTNDNCIEFYNLQPGTTSDYTRGSSTYWIVPFPINSTTGKIVDVTVTNTSYFLLRDSESSADWNVSYITNITRTDQVQSSTNNGVSYSNFSGTIDMHVHQFSANDSLWYYVCANDTAGNGNCSDVRQDLLQLDHLPPSSPDVYNPTEGVHGGDITINYTESISPNAYPITHYNITLVYLNLSLAKIIRGNNSLNLSYVWDSSSVSDGQYFIRVEACDNQSQCSYGYSENITLDNTPPTIGNLSRNPATPHEDQNFDVGAMATDSGSGVNSCYLEINSQNYTMTKSGDNCNITVYNSGLGNYTAHDTVNYYIWSDDTVGNWQRTSQQSFTVANQAPNASATYLPLNNTNSSTAQLHWNLSVDPDDEDTVYYWIRINDTTGIYYKSGTSTTLSLPQGYYCWNVTSTDTYVNTTTSGTSCFTKVAAAFDIYIKDEMTGNDMNVSNFTSATLRVYCSNSSTTYNVTSTPIPVAEACVVDEIRLTLNLGGIQHFRTLIPTTTSGNVTFYMINTYNDQHVFKTVTISDLTGDYSGGIFHVQKLIGSKQVDIIDQEVDAVNQIYLYLILDEKYIFSIENSAGTVRTLGPITANTDATETISLPAIEFAPSENYLYTGIYNGHDVNWSSGLLRFIYNDTRELTDWVNFELWNFTNSSNITRIYVNNQSGNNLLWSYNISFGNTTFFYNWTGYHQEYGDISGGSVIGYASFGNIRLSFGGYSSTIYQIVAMITLMLIAMLFSYRHSEIGIIILGVFAFTFWYWGWLNIVFGAVMLILIVVVISAFGRKAREVGG